MAKLGTQQVKELAKTIISKSLGGIRYSQLVKAISSESPETPTNTINGCIWNIDTQFPSLISKPSRGLFKWISEDESSSGLSNGSDPSKTKLRESDFYEPFSDWLKNDLDEVTVSTALGGAGLKEKWGTPDVVGVYKPLASDFVKFPLEVVSVEIKITPAETVVAFGQAIAYRLFSSKTYIVMPTTIGADDLDRLESLCMLFGVGLVLFELQTKEPNFSIRVRAQRFSPDMFYVNKFAESLRIHDPKKFQDLFG